LKDLTEQALVYLGLLGLLLGLYIRCETAHFRFIHRIQAPI
jgi:hypothetical protein